MKQRLLTRKQLNELLDKLAQEVCLYAPVRDRTGTSWAKISRADEVCLEEVNTVEPAKGFVFPRCEVLVRFDPQGNPVEPEPPPEQVVFGIRPCDARGIAFLVKFYTQEGRTDPYVKARREKTTLIGVACSRTAPTCFCLALGGSPQGSEGLDLLLVELGEELLAEPVTEKGERLVADLPEAEEKHLTAAAEQRKRWRLRSASGLTPRNSKSFCPIFMMLRSGRPLPSPVSTVAPAPSSAPPATALMSPMRRSGAGRSGAGSGTPASLPSIPGTPRAITRAMTRPQDTATGLWTSSTIPSSRRV